MANEIEKAGVFGGKVGMLDTASLATALQQSAQLDPRGAAADGSDYMNFSGKRGVYEVGKEKRDISKDELWLVNVPAFEDGWICWKGGRVMASRLARLGTPVPSVDTSEHGPFTGQGDGWHQAKSMTIKSLDTGQQCYFKINSVSGVSVFADLQKEITSRILAGEPCWPVVGFDREFFTAQGHRNSKPIIIIDGWLSSQQVSEELPAIFEDENAELDLDAMYAAAITPKPTPTIGAADETKAVRRNRRSL